MSETTPLTEENSSRFLTTKLHKIHYNEAGPSVSSSGEADPRVVSLS